MVSSKTGFDENCHFGTQITANIYTGCVVHDA